MGSASPLLLLLHCQFYRTLLTGHFSVPIDLPQTVCTHGAFFQRPWARTIGSPTLSTILGRSWANPSTTPISWTRSPEPKTYAPFGACLTLEGIDTTMPNPPEEGRQNTGKEGQSQRHGVDPRQDHMRGFEGR